MSSVGTLNVHLASLLPLSIGMAGPEEPCAGSSGLACTSPPIIINNQQASLEHARYSLLDLCCITGTVEVDLLLHAFLCAGQTLAGGVHTVAHSGRDGPSALGTIAAAAQCQIGAPLLCLLTETSECARWCPQRFPNENGQVGVFGLDAEVALLDK